MRHLRHLLAQTELFQGLPDIRIHQLLQSMRYHVANFDDGQAIAIEGAQCSHLGIVLEGHVDITKAFQTGWQVTIARLRAGSAFGEAVLFLDDRRYPATIVAGGSPCTVMFIPNQQVIVLCQSDSRVFRNFARLLSARILLLNRKVKSLSYQTIREKVASFILEQQSRQQTSRIELELSRQHMAELLGIPRPSLSRELMRLRDEGLITFSGRRIHIRNQQGLEDCLG